MLLKETLLHIFDTNNFPHFFLYMTTSKCLDRFVACMASVAKQHMCTWIHQFKSRFCYSTVDFVNNFFATIYSFLLLYTFTCTVFHSRTISFIQHSPPVYISLSGCPFIQLCITIPSRSGEYCLNHKTRLTFPLCLAQGEPVSCPSCYVMHRDWGLGSWTRFNQHLLRMRESSANWIFLLFRQGRRCQSRSLVREIWLPARSVFISACEWVVWQLFTL